MSQRRRAPLPILVLLAAGPTRQPSRPERALHLKGAHSRPCIDGIAGPVHKVALMLCPDWVRPPAARPAPNRRLSQSQDQVPSLSMPWTIRSCEFCRSC
jgi:hypothetical protein